jgi:hypothetical protein
MLALPALAACGQGTSTPQPTDAGLEVPTTAAPTDVPATEPPVESTTAPPSATQPPETEPSAPTATAGPTVAPTTSPIEGAGSAAVCSGSDENRDFFASMAAAVDWTVYCPVLDDGWFVDDGRYRLAGGGWLEISYDGPGDARLILRQGAFCETAGGCAGTGRDAGSTAFGVETGLLVERDDGSWEVAVGNGQTISWLLVVHGLDVAAVRQISASLHAVTD